MTDAVKMAAIAIKMGNDLSSMIENQCAFHCVGRDCGCKDSAKQARSDAGKMAEALRALEQAGEPVADANRHRYTGDQSDLRLRFDTALAGMATANGDSGWIIHTHGHADDMERAIKVIEELRAAPLPTLQRLGQEFDADRNEAIMALTAKFGPILKAAFPNEHSRTRFDVDNALAEVALATPSQPDPQSREPSLTVADAWQDLVDKDDRTSPEEYPDMALITREELADYMQSAQSRGQAFDGEGEGWQPIETAPKDGSWVLAFFPGDYDGRILRARWNDDRYGKNTRPHFESDNDRVFGKLERRKSQPSHWMPLPDTPALSSAKRGE